jgi:hypothetical protein
MNLAEFRLMRLREVFGDWDLFDPKAPWNQEDDDDTP